MDGGGRGAEAHMPTESLSHLMSTSAPAPSQSAMRNMALSPGGSSFENYIYRPETLRKQRNKRRIVHRNIDQVLPETTETEEGSLDPIQSVRKAAGYNELVEKCEPGAEIHRVHPADLSRKDDHIGPQNVEDVRRKLLSKIQTNVMQERNRVLAERHRRGWEPDENSPLIGGTRENEDPDNVSFTSQLSMPFMTPDHLLPASFYQIHIPFKKLDELINHGDQSKSSTLVTTLAIWNTMMGTSLLSIPWGIKQSGLIASVIIGLVMAFVAGYTAVLVIKIHAKYDTPLNPIKEFAQLCGKLLGPKFEYVSGISSIMAVTGAVIVYWVLMSNFLRNTVDLIAHSIFHKNSTTLHSFMDLQLGETHVICPGNNSAVHSHVHINDTVHDMQYTSSSIFTHDFAQNGLIADDLPPMFEQFWNKSTVPFFLLFLFPIISMRSVTFFTKFNVIGTVSVFFVIAIVIYWATIWGINVNFHDTTSPEYVPMFESTLPSLSGMLALGLFIHNAIITITQNHEKPEKNTFCVVAAFTMVITTYLFVGLLYYISFPLPKWCIEDNLMNNFPIDQLEVIVARILLLVQLIAIFPLICYIWRAQILSLFGVDETMCAIIVVNTLVVTICIFFAVFMPNIGTIIRFTGASCGFIMIFLLPCCCELVHRRYESNLRQWVVFCKIYWKPCSIHFLIICLGFGNMIAQFVF